MFYEDTSQTALDCLERRVAELTAALKEARAMLRACGLEEPDDQYQAMWDRGLAKIDAALATVE